MSIKAIFFDMDGTLYDWKNERFPVSALHALAALKEKGIKIFLCTARNYVSLEHFGLWDLGIDWDGCIACNGGQAEVDGEFVHKNVFAPKQCKKIIAYCNKRHIRVLAMTPRGKFFNCGETKTFAEFSTVFVETPAPVKRYEGEEVVRLTLYCEKERDPVLENEFPGLFYYRFHPTALDITNAPNYKGHGVAAILKKLGFSKDEALGFGDGMDDVGMKLGLAHFVAMGNASEAVKAEAEYVTSPVDEDGILRGLIHYGILPKNFV
ncbi:MAG: HAD-IIB family hydrolase [Bacilli bacterium]|nr:HAD-IIB family hydrolase [Bacilli bacterium]